MLMFGLLSSIITIVNNHQVIWRVFWGWWPSRYGKFLATSLKMCIYKQKCCYSYHVRSIVLSSWLLLVRCCSKNQPIVERVLCSCSKSLFHHQLCWFLTLYHKLRALRSIVRWDKMSFCVTHVVWLGQLRPMCVGWIISYSRHIACRVRWIQSRMFVQFLCCC